MSHTNVTIVCGDARQMKLVPDQSVHLIVTSPPYWRIKDYNIAGQIGFCQSYEEYVDSLNQVWTECYRVLHEGCRLCINIGDQFIRATRGETYKVIPIRESIIHYCTTQLELTFLGNIIWSKPTNLQTSGGAIIMGSYPFPRNGIIKLNYEFILVFRKPGKSPTVTTEAKEASRLTRDEWNTYFMSKWTFPGARQVKHPAPFPEELPKRLIKMFSFVGETVLDPFIGSGTTALAARKLGRHAIGYELNPDYLPVIEERVGPPIQFLTQP